MSKIRRSSGKMSWFDAPSRFSFRADLLFFARPIHRHQNMPRRRWIYRVGAPIQRQNQGLVGSLGGCIVRPMMADQFPESLVTHL